ncbi:MAG: S-adenosylmethionine:tRNA ribosyltransferase-isomerase [Bacteroidales bacterium]|nr:S-adenosylmethionine:tRNA ribosyltransferase-isomerase [Bacteroidales bacterium]
MTDIKNLSIDEYDYPLPEERIAKYPLAERDASKLLVLKDNKLQASQFRHIGEFLPPKALLVFNETKVIRARLQFQKETGSHIEIFCLEPEQDYQIAFSSASPVRWKCLVGNSKRWREGLLQMKLNVQGQEVVLSAERVEKNDQYSEIEFSWTPAELPFASILEVAGEIPLPPYLNRDAEPEDRDRYQTVFARYDGSVAAPTAGLHFTKPLLEQLKAEGFELDEVTLHVGAGTFRPVATPTIGEHAMHSETVIVRKSLIQNLINHLGGNIIPVGTTSTRTLESLYWIGMMLHEQGLALRDLHVDQWYPYESHPDLSTRDALQLILDYLDLHQLTRLEASTALMIAPSYRMKVITGLITNFHQPKSTLLLLVSALIGDQWKTAYQFALENGFRFLSYGDSCLFL